MLQVPCSELHHYNCAETSRCASTLRAGGRVCVNCILCVLHKAAELPAWRQRKCTLLMRRSLLPFSRLLCLRVWESLQPSATHVFPLWKLNKHFNFNITTVRQRQECLRSLYHVNEKVNALNDELQEGGFTTQAKWRRIGRCISSSFLTLTSAYFHLSRARVCYLSTHNGRCWISVNSSTCGVWSLVSALCSLTKHDS